MIMIIQKLRVNDVIRSAIWKKKIEIASKRKRERERRTRREEQNKLKNKIRKLNNIANNRFLVNK